MGSRLNGIAVPQNESTRQPDFGSTARCGSDDSLFAPGQPNLVELGG